MIEKMNPRVSLVKPNPDYTLTLTLTLTFTNGEIKVFDVKPYLDKGIFRELRDLQQFNSVQPFLGSIQWVNGQDFCPDTLYLDSVVRSTTTDTDGTVTGSNGFMSEWKAEISSNVPGTVHKQGEHNG